jgi:YesN/AraC family two-component response regulator
MEENMDTKDEGLLKRLSILLVEDDENILKLITIFLKRRIGAVYTAVNGEEGLAIFKKQRPDIVLTDIRLPVMDGLSMAKAIREIDADTPIIVITAFSKQDLLLKSIDIEDYNHVIKPVDTEVLMDTILKNAAALFQQREMVKNG